MTMCHDDFAVPVDCNQSGRAFVSVASLHNSLRWSSHRGEPVPDRRFLCLERLRCTRSWDLHVGEVDVEDGLKVSLPLLVELLQRRCASQNCQKIDVKLLGTQSN